MSTTPRLLGGRYEVGEVLGRGGMAEVHVGRDTRLGRTVAVKMLRSDLARDPSFQARFRREAQSAAALNHPSVVAVYDSGEEPASADGGTAPYIVMEYVEGRTLRELLTVGQTMPWEEALRVTSGVLAALAYSHRAGIVHRDIKPANVMLTPTGDVKVMDFGIARALADTSATMTQTQAVIGTAQYLSPEQARGETVDARSDLYSAGCLLFELLTGRPPFVADSPVAVAYQHVGEPPRAPSTVVPSLPHPVDAIVLHSLVKDRESRYQSADQFRDDVEAALAGRRISSAALGSATGLVGTEPATEAVRDLLGSSPFPTGYGAAVPEATRAMRTVEPVQPAGDIGPAGRAAARPRRAGMWVLLGLLLAALVAVSVLVLPNLLGPRTPTVRRVDVPTVVGMSEAQATTRLTEAGLRVGKTTDTPSDDVAKGSVVEQDPTGGGRLAEDSPVDLVLSTGPESIEVPELEGRTEDEATTILTEAGLTPGEVTQVESPDVDKGEVVGSSPAAGQAVAPDTTVDLQVASGKVDVPNVIGLSLVDATAKLTQAGLAVDATRYRDSTQPENSVIDQTMQGRTVVKGARIRLVIARKVAPPTTSPPTQSPSSTATAPATTGTGTGTGTASPPG